MYFHVIFYNKLPLEKDNGKIYPCISIILQLRYIPLEKKKALFYNNLNLHSRMLQRVPAYSLSEAKFSL